VSTLPDHTNVIAQSGSVVVDVKSTSMSVSRIHARMREPASMSEAASDVFACLVRIMLSQSSALNDVTNLLTNRNTWVHRSRFWERSFKYIQILFKSSVNKLIKQLMQRKVGLKAETLKKICF
jgi:hypothetical protein